MLFEVINSEGKTVMQTSDSSCVPTQDELEAIGSSGYRFKVDGKLLGRTKVLNAVSNSTGNVIATESASIAQPIAKESKPAIVKDNVIAKPTGSLESDKSVSSSNTKLKPKRLFDLDSILGNK